MSRGIIVRENDRIKRGSPEYRVYQRLACDIFIVTDNATQAYTMFRRIVDGADFEESKSVASTASSFFKTNEENVFYIEQRRRELLRWGFDGYIKENNLDASAIVQIEDKVYDIENITSDDIREKNLAELERIIKSNAKESDKLQAIKQQTELMDAKKKSEEESRTDNFIHFYLPLPYCKNCEHKPSLSGEENIEEE